MVFIFFPNHLFICPLHKYPSKTASGVDNFTRNLYIERNNGFSFKFPYVWDPKTATLYAFRISRLLNEGLTCNKLYQLVYNKQWKHMESNECNILNSFAFSFWFRWNRNLCSQLGVCVCVGKKVCLELLLDGKSDELQTLWVGAYHWDVVPPDLWRHKSKVKGSKVKKKNKIMPLSAFQRIKMTSKYHICQANETTKNVTLKK